MPVGRSQVEIHPADIDNCKIPGEIFFAQKSAADHSGYVGNSDLCIAQGKIA
jgi:hypothetical protein